MTDTSTGDSAVVGDQAYNVVAPSTGLYFEDDIGSIGDSVTITNGVAIDSTGGFDPGIEIYGEFDTVCYDGLASGSIISDDAGIAVDMLSNGNVLLDIAHNITAGDVGIVVDHLGDGLVDINAGAIDGLFSGIAVIRGGVGNTMIDVNGPITSLAGAGIFVQSMGTGTISVTANGSIESAGGGILVARSIGDGNIDITANAAVDGGIGPAIFVSVDPFSTGDLDIVANANLTSEDSGIAAVHWGDSGDVTISTAPGTIIDAHGGSGPPLFALSISGTVGIYVDRSGTVDSDITITNGAAIDVDAVGMYIDVCACINADLLVNSTGTIAVDTGFGIYVAKGATGDTTVNQSGMVTVLDGTGLFIDQLDAGNVIAGLTGGVSATDGGIVVNQQADGNVTANLGGVSTITNGKGAEIFHAAAGTVDVNSTAALTASDTGIDIEHAGTGNVSFDIDSGTIAAPRGVSTVAAANTITGTIASAAVIDVTGAGPGRFGVSLDSMLSRLTVGGTIDAMGTDAILFTGGDAQLTLLPGFVINGQVDALASATNSLTLGGDAGDGTFDLDRLGTAFTDFDTYMKTGASTWTLSGDNFTGLLSATGGTVVINDSIAGLDLSLTGATLKGNAAIGSLAANAAIIAPGNSIGTVTVAGDVAIVGTSVYEVEVNASGASDKIEAGGIATLTSTASVGVTMEPGTYGAVTQYTILSAAGGVAGTFDPDLGFTSAFFDAALSYDPNNVYLTLTRNSLTLDDFAGTPNQEAAAEALDAAGLGAPYFDELFVLPADEIPGALDAISGDGYASLTAAALDDGRFVRDAALDRRGARGVWTTPYGGVAHLPGDGNGPAVDHATGGLLLGADGEVGDGWLGMLLGYGQSRYDIAARDMSATSNEFSLGTYGGAQWDAFHASFGAAITGRDIGATRRVIFPGVSDTFTADYASLTAQAFTELGYRLDMGGTAVTPFGGLAVLSATTSGYTESGTGAGALTVAPSAATALVATLGLRLEHEIALEDDRTLTLRASAAWRHAIGGASTANAAAGMGTFTVAGAPLPADTLAVSAGTTLDLGQVSVGVDYTGSFGSGGFANAATATLAGTF